MSKTMKTVTVIVVLSLFAMIQTASVSSYAVQQNKDHLVWNIALTEDEHIGSFKEGIVDSDIYWKPWRKGTVPKDALVGAYGNSECGSDVPIYITQAFHKGSEAAILPGQVFKRSRAVTVSYGRNQFKYNENVKILCADDPSIVTWVPIKDTGILDVSADKDCVIGGSELSFNTFIGRTNYEDETKIGKVLAHTKTMFFPHEGQEISVKENFDILCYTRAIETKRLEASKKKVEVQKVNTEPEKPSEPVIQSENEASSTPKPFSFGRYPRLS